ncbi:GNAT family N-acetyltransferase [Pontibacter sp. SGAir0037]|uniref:GNAT family N-acetyltransferase n=1 Tax=Pontibacter sp. SGAir0037 TaxID=2571030 RepID=UPI0010CD60D6|nr:GNAT family N-acetyltransferase [Pontibacter sp. SGAir0037]QCR24708.1 GNAT family N-acetyltransferase [Pontibacter sp. SGAir0037]
MENNYTIREASTADVPTINALAEAIWEPTYSSILSKEQIDYMFEVIYTAEALQQQMQEGQTFLLMYLQEQPIGFAAFSEKYPDEKVYKLNKIYLLPSCQGKGLGFELISEVEQVIQRRGGRILDLNVNRYNKAKDFYERCGYQVHQEEDIPIGPYWMNDYIMRKQLV